MKFHPFAAGGLFGVLDRMIVSDIAKTVSAVLGVLTLIVVSRRFLSILGKAIEGEVAGGIIFTLLGLKTVTTLVELLPVALFISVLMVFGRMHRDNEMAVLAASGVGIGHLCRSVFLLVGPLALAAGGLSLQVLPWSAAETQRLLVRSENIADVRGITAGRFNEYSKGELVFFIEDINSKREMSNIFVQNRQDGKLGIIVSEHGRVVDMEEGRYIVLENGKRYQGEPGEAAFTVTEFAEYGVRIGQAVNSEVKTKREGTPSRELLQSGELRDMVEFQRRLSVPLGATALALLAVPLARISPRGGIYGNVFSAILIYIIYGNLLRVAEVWTLEAVLPAWGGYLLVYALLAAGALVLIARNAGWSWRHNTASSLARTPG